MTRPIRGGTHDRPRKSDPHPSRGFDRGRAFTALSGLQAWHRQAKRTGATEHRRGPACRHGRVTLARAVVGLLAFGPIDGHPESERPPTKWLRVLSLYDGRALLGHIKIADNGEVRAFDQCGKLLGQFASLKSALVAFDQRGLKGAGRKGAPRINQDSGAVAR
jgi:hypothetical protein